MILMIQGPFHVPYQNGKNPNSNCTDLFCVKRRANNCNIYIKLKHKEIYKILKRICIY